MKGSSGECQWEPRWKEIYPRIPLPDASDEAKIEAQEWLSTLHLECGKLSMNPSACHGCPDNPKGKEQQHEKDNDTSLIETYGPELDLTSRHFTSSRLGLLTATELSETEFQCLSVFYWEWEKLARG